MYGDCYFLQCYLNYLEEKLGMSDIYAAIEMLIEFRCDVIRGLLKFW